MSDRRRPEGPKAVYFIGVLIAILGGGLGAAIARWVDAPVWFSVVLWLVGLLVGFRIAALVNARLFADTVD